MVMSPKEIHIAIEALERKRAEAFFTKEIKEIDQAIHELKKKLKEIRR